MNAAIAVPTSANVVPTQCSQCVNVACVQEYKKQVLFLNVLPLTLIFNPYVLYGLNQVLCGQVSKVRGALLLNRSHGLIQVLAETRDGTRGQRRERGFMIVRTIVCVRCMSVADGRCIDSVRSPNIPRPHALHSNSRALRQHQHVYT
jgi:hypothetical protein